MNESEKEVCPKCGSSLIVQLGTQKHCNACGHDEVSRNPISDAVAKRRAEGFQGGWRRPQNT